MNWIRLFLVCLAGVTAGTWGCSRADPESQSGPQMARLTVSEHGFAPLEVQAREGKPLTMLVTRESDASCAKQIIIADAGIHRMLPIKQEVRITFTPEKRGDLRYTCCDEMVGGRIVVR